MKTLSMFRLWLAYWVMPKKSREALRRLAEGSQAINPTWTADDILKELEKRNDWMERTPDHADDACG